MLSNEEIRYEEETEQEESKAQIYDILSYPSDLTLSGIVSMFQNNDIIIPDYQRSYVWTIKQASMLIDSFLRGLPVPPIFLFQMDDGKSLIIDGQQRVLSIFYFFSGFFGEADQNGKRRVFKLTGLPANTEWNNCSFTELTEDLQRKLRNQSILRAMNIKQTAPHINSNVKSSAYAIFERLNTGGTPLRPQEVRNAVYAGRFNTELKQLNENSFWRQIIGTSTQDKHQKDVEFILRIFSLSARFDDYEKPLKDFLNETMSMYCDGKGAMVQHFISIFPKVCEDIVTHMGPSPFKLRGPLNVAALDSVMSVMIKEYGKYDPKRLTEGWKNLKENPDFIERTTYNTTDKISVLSRCYLVQTILLGLENSNE